MMFILDKIESKEEIAKSDSRENAEKNVSRGSRLTVERLAGI